MSKSTLLGLLEGPVRYCPWKCLRGREHHTASLREVCKIIGLIDKGEVLDKTGHS